MLREHSFPAAGRVLVLPVGAPFSSLGSDSFWDAGKERGELSPADSGQPSGASALHVSKIAQMFWGERERAKVRERLSCQGSGGVQRLGAFWAGVQRTL